MPGCFACPLLRSTRLVKRANTIIAEAGPLNNCVRSCLMPNHAQRQIVALLVLTVAMSQKTHVFSLGVFSQFCIMFNITADIFK